MLARSSELGDNGSEVIVDRTTRFFTRSRLAVLSLVLPLLGVGAALGFVIRGQIGTTGPESLAQGGPLVVSLEERVLSQTTVINARLIATGLAVPAPVVENAGTIVTGLPLTEGEIVEPGDVLAVVSDRPVFALVGSIPAYRDLKPGNVGSDVEQLNNGLFQLGLRRDAGADTFDEATQAAVATLYQRAGLSAPTTLDDFDESRAALLQEADSAEAAVSAAATADAAAVTEWERAVAAAERQLDFAHEALNVVRASSTSSGTEPVEEASGDANGAVDPEAERSLALLEAENAVVEATVALEMVRESPPAPSRPSAVDALQTARLALEEFDQTEGVFMPRGEVLFVPDQDVAVATVATQVGEQVAPGQSLLTLDVGGFVWQGEVPNEFVGAVAIGTEARALDPESGERIELVVVGIGDGGPMTAQTEPANITEGANDEPAPDEGETAAPAGSTRSGESPFSTLRLTSTAGGALSTPVPQELTVELVLRTSDGPVLAAPNRAVLSVGGLKGEVRIMADGGRGGDWPFEVVEVTPGMVADGYVELRDPAPALKPGTELLVGHSAVDTD